MIKIYATADIHGAQHRVNEALSAIKKYKPDLVVIAGDITQFGPGDVATLILNQFPEPVFAVPGNIDTADVWKGIERSHATNLHKNQIEFKNLMFTGINGVDDAETELFLSDPSFNDLLDSTQVLVTHVPPHGFQDAVFLGKHAGSKPLRKIMDKIQPRLVISGHIHEKPGYTTHERTTIVNCSMGKRGQGALIQVNDEIDVTMLD